MRSDESTRTKFKHLCADLTNLEILTKSATLGWIQINFGHAYIDNNFTTFSLVGSLESTAVVSMEPKRAFSSTAKNTRLLVTEVLICAAVDDISRPKKLINWASLNTRSPLHSICWNGMDWKLHQIPSTPPWNGMEYFYIIPYVLIPLNSIYFHKIPYMEFLSGIFHGI